ncbi:MAG: sorbitol dehydrogenase [Pseudomonadota bacterium]
MTTTQQDMALFVGLSSVLTGIDKKKLAPPLDPSNIKQVFYDCANIEDGPVLAQLLAVYAGCRAEPPAIVAETVFKRSGPDVCYLARAIMLSWYLGSWYRPIELQQHQDAEPAPPPSLAPLSARVITAATYTQGWAWNIAQAHPMGYSNLGFGYWADQPPALADFTGAEQ